MPIGSFDCSLEAILFLISGKWKPLIIHRLQNRPLRYGELQRVIDGISHKMLAQQLKQLELDGLVVRTDFGEKPFRVEYRLSEAGDSLANALNRLGEWGTDHAFLFEGLVETKRTRDERATFDSS